MSATCTCLVSSLIYQDRRREQLHRELPCADVGDHWETNMMLMLRRKDQTGLLRNATIPWAYIMHDRMAENQGHMARHVILRFGVDITLSQGNTMISLDFVVKL